MNELNNLLPDMKIDPALIPQRAESTDARFIGSYDDVEITETEYLFFPWFIRGKLNALQGDSNTGKSTLLYCIGAYVSTGRNIFGIPCEAPGNVMFITLEDSESDIKTAFTDSGGDPKRLMRIKDRKLIARMQFDDKKCLQFIEDTIRNHDLKFLVFDPIQAFLGGDLNKANSTRPQMEALAEIAESTECCITFIQHMGKDSSRKGLHRGLGSTDIVAATRSLLQVSQDPDNEDFVIAYTIKNNTAAKRDTQQAIRYEIKDSPNAIDYQTKKHHRYHGHAVLTELLPKYNERIHTAKLAKHDYSVLSDKTDYESDPLVITIRKLAEQNPQGLFIRYSELIRRITETCGKCPYDQSKRQDTGLNNHVDSIRGRMIEMDKIQIDRTRNALQFQAYHWNDAIVSPEAGAKHERGINITILK